MIKTSRDGILLLLAGAALLGGCTKDDGVDYCRNHYQFHDEHVESSAVLALTIDEVGAVSGSLMIPSVAFRGDTSEQIAAMIQGAGGIFEPGPDYSCDLPKGGITMSAEGLRFEFAANCGSEGGLDSMNIVLLDHLPEVEELVTTITTHATSKHFAISRQCASPIFRLENPNR